MCGILYSHDSESFSDLTVLKKRGPEGFCEVSNDLGYFFHSMLNTIGDLTQQPLANKHGLLLYNGSTYNSKNQNDAKWIVDRLDNNLDNTIEIIQNLNGEYALIYVTDTHIVFCVDPFDQRNLWFFHDSYHKQFTASSVPTVVKQKHITSWRAEGNKIYVINRNDYSVDIRVNRNFNLDQKHNHFDYVIENFEQAVQNRYDPSISINLLSSGFDSGVIACATNKFFDKVYCVGDPAKELKTVLQDRILLHDAILVPNYVGDQIEKMQMFHDLISKNDVWDDPLVNSLCNIIKECILKKKKKVVITGNGGDEIYNDWYGQMHELQWSKTNSYFASALELLWPWHNYKGRSMLACTRMDFICGYFGLESRNPLYDINLVQSWLNTTTQLKNKGYKSWMKHYMDQENYPHSMTKCHWGHDEYNPESWKLHERKI